MVLHKSINYKYPLQNSAKKNLALVQKLRKNTLTTYSQIENLVSLKSAKDQRYLFWSAWLFSASESELSDDEELHEDEEDDPELELPVNARETNI